jgi:hypothetical protein
MANAHTTTLNSTPPLTIAMAHKSTRLRFPAFSSQYSIAEMGTTASTFLRNLLGKPTPLHCLT